jgi:hypothetical protein
MSIDPISRAGNPSVPPPPGARTPAGLSQVPDRFEDRGAPEEKPGFFKKYLFNPIYGAIKFIFRAIFNFVDYIRKMAFEDTRSQYVAPKQEPPPDEREVFVNLLHSAPSHEELFNHFVRLYPREKRELIYEAIGESQESSLKDLFWKENNIDLGRRLARKDPRILYDYLK